MKKTFVLMLALSGFGLNAFAGEGVSFLQPANKATVEKTFHVKFGLEGRKLCEANKESTDKTCGHHHLLIDGKAVPAGEVIGADTQHVHFGKMQTETDVTLTPGKHTLTLQFADFAHKSYGEKWSQTIEVQVK